jgi:hypothetical protein
VFDDVKHTNRVKGTIQERQIENGRFDELCPYCGPVGSDYYAIDAYVVSNAFARQERS